MKFLNKEIRNYAKLILHSPLLSGMSMVQRNTFLSYCHKRNFKKDEFIFYQGDPASGLYIVESGAVYLFHPESPNEGITIGPYRSFAEFSLTSDINRTYTAQCSDDCVLFGFFKPDFEVLKSRHPEIAVTVFESIMELATQLFELATGKKHAQSNHKNMAQVHFELYHSQSEIISE